MSSDHELPTTVDFAKLLQHHHGDFLDMLNVSALIPLMGKYNLLTVKECQEIHSKSTDSDKIDHLVHCVLPRKGKRAYQKFVKCLELETQHLGHPELVDKIKKTAETLKLQPFKSVDTATDSEESGVIIKAIANCLLSRDNKIKELEEKLAEQEIQIRQMDKLISDLRQSHSSHPPTHAVTEVAKLQKLLDYINGGHGSQLSSSHDTCVIAKHYRDLRLIMKDVKNHLQQDAEYVHCCINTTTDESDGIRSRTSSLDSEIQPHKVKISNFTELSSESVKESNEETAEEVAEESESFSSADETDDEILETKLEPEQQLKIERRLKLQLKQRPESWISFKEKRTSKAFSRLSMSSTTQPRKGSTTDSDANDDGHLQEELHIVDDVTSKEVEYENEDVNLACSNVGLSISSIDVQEESSRTVLAGYLHKEGTGPHDRWKKRYFTLTKECLYYSKSKHDGRLINGFPLIGLALEKKKTRTFEVVNIQATNIKVDRPGNRQVPIADYKVIKLKASSQSEALKWIQSIEDAIAKFKSQYFLTHD